VRGLGRTGDEPSHLAPVWHEFTRRSLPHPPGIAPSRPAHASGPSCGGVLCYIIRGIVAAPDAGSMPAPTGGGTHPVNPLPAKRIPAQIRSLCRAYTGEAVRSLAAIMRNADAPPRARLRAIDILLDRGWGKPSQPRAEEDGKKVRVTIRKIVSD
jgi:hypothetical protein